MSNDVFANGREISCKAADGKSICCFPDVCFTPPENPATPPGVPIPYPNTGMATDTTSGSKTVNISKKEVILKNKSYFKKSMGDEAGCAAKKGVITSTHRGKIYFTSWSMDVKFEGENVTRTFDLTTHNHASMPGNTPPWAYVDGMNLDSPGKPIKECKEEAKKANEACEGKNTREAQCADDNCREAKKCMLVSYNQGKRKSQSTNVGCCDGEQPHHLVEAHCFFEAGGRGTTPSVKAPAGKETYDDKNAPCVCASGPRHAKKHGQYHAFQSAMESAHHNANGKWSYGDARDAGVKAHKAVNPQCSEECTKAQLDSYHKKQCGLRENTRLRTDPQAGTRSKGELSAAQKQVLKRAIKSARIKRR